MKHLDILKTGMKIKYHKKFLKRFDKFSLKDKKRITKAIKRFLKDPFNEQLKNHKLAGKLSKCRAISVTGDIRIIFKEFDEYTLVILLNVGTHNQVYKKF